MPYSPTKLRALLAAHFPDRMRRPGAVAGRFLHAACGGAIALRRLQRILAGTLVPNAVELDALARAGGFGVVDVYEAQATQTPSPESR